MPPRCLNTIYLPPEVGRTLEGIQELTYPGTCSSVPIVELPGTRLRHPVAEAEQSITAVRATAALPSKVACDADGALLRIDRLCRSVPFPTAGRSRLVRSARIPDPLDVIDHPTWGCLLLDKTPYSLTPQVDH